MPIVRKNIEPAYEFVNSQDATKIIKKGGVETPFDIPSEIGAGQSFCLQVIFSDLDMASAATVYLMLSMDSVNYQRITAKECVVSGASVTGYFIFPDPAMSRARYAQIGITGVTAPGKIQSVIFGC